MSVIGYKRVSSVSQSTERQELGQVDKLFEEKQSGKDTKGRPSLLAMIDYAREGDVVKVHSIDRLARDLRDLQSIISDLNDKGVTITFLTENRRTVLSTDYRYAMMSMKSSPS